MEQQYGFIRDMLDVKCLILFVMKNVQYPLTLQKIYELCFQDDKLSYFDLSIAVPQMVESGHLAQVERDQYCITPLGVEAEEATRSSVAIPVQRRALQAIDAYNRQCQRERLIETAVRQNEKGEYIVELELHDPIGRLMKLELFAPDEQQAKALEKNYRLRAERVYRALMSELQKNADV